MLTINTNVASLQAQKNLSGAQFNLDKAIDHLSSGLRITSAADDADGLKAAMLARGTIASLNSAARSTQTAIAQAQTSEGYLNEATTILIRLNEISASSTEATALKTRLDQIGGSAAFGSVTATVDEAGGTVATTGTFTLTSATTLTQVADMRADLGATANVLQDALGTIQTAITNQSAVVSSIQDVDVAEETSKLSRSQVLAQAGVAVLAQANQLPQMALKLLG
jgi:flagellin